MFLEDQIVKIEEYVGLLFSIKNIVVMLDFPEKEFVKELRNTNSPASKAYNRGKLMTEIELRRNLLKLSLLGSQTAQSEILQLLKKQQIDDRLL